jgi:uncharacterized coiled-coil protein SlyX
VIIALDRTQIRQAETQTIEKINDQLEQRVRDRTAKIQQQTERMRVLANKLGQAEQKERNIYPKRYWLDLKKDI